jgi:proteasome lid subunit RPN8/RPN11
VAVLIIPASVARQIEKEGIAAYPNECCGILIGREAGGRRRVERLVPMKNAFDPSERYHRFAIDPLAQIEAEKSADAEGTMVLGYYHSHPDHPAVPSEYDRLHVPPWSFYSHVIVAIGQGRSKAMNAWYLDEESLQFKSVKIVEE